MKNSDELSKFLDTLKLIKLTHEKIDSLSSLVSIIEMKRLIKNVSTKKLLVSDRFSSLLYLTFKEEIIPIVYKCFEKIDKEELPPIHFESGITLIEKSDKYITRKETKG